MTDQYLSVTVAEHIPPRVVIYERDICHPAPSHEIFIAGRHLGESIRIYTVGKTPAVLTAIQRGDLVIVPSIESTSEQLTPAAIVIETDIETSDSDTVDMEYQPVIPAIRRGRKPKPR